MMRPVSQPATAGIKTTLTTTGPNSRGQPKGTIWGISNFDQWGVELGKQLALQIIPAIEGDDAALEWQDASTQALIAYYQVKRK